MERSSVKLSPGWLIWLACLVLMLPLRWIVSWILAACIHEAGHLFMLKLLGADVHGIQIGVYGAKINTGYLFAWQELFCAITGPLAGGLLLFAAPWFPRLALCAAFQTVYNLLPVYPLDGGRVIHSCAGLLLPEKWARRLCVFLEAICLAGIVWLGIYGSVALKLGLLPLLPAIMVVIRSLQGKIPCKDAKQAVQ